MPGVRRDALLRELTESPAANTRAERHAVIASDRRRTLAVFILDDEMAMY